MYNTTIMLEALCVDESSIKLEEVGEEKAYLHTKSVERDSR